MIVHAHIDRLWRAAKFCRDGEAGGGIDQGRKDAAMRKTLVGIGDELVALRREDIHFSFGRMRQLQVHPAGQMIAAQPGRS